MKYFFGSSASGDLSEVTALIQNPTLLILFTTEENFEKHVRELEETFPNVPSIGTIGSSYAGTQYTETGVTVVAFSESIKAIANVIPNLSKTPVKYIKQISDELIKIKATQRDTVFLDFTTGYDSKILTCVNSVLAPKMISVVGGTSCAPKVSANGVIYEDACVYAFIKNRGAVKVFKENIYKPTKFKFTATSTEKEGYMLHELDGKPAKEVYCDALNITEDKVATQTFRNPLGRNLGYDFQILSLKGVVGDSLACHKQANNMDVFSIMELDDYKTIIHDTIDNIKDDFTAITGVLSFNCIYRCELFKELNYLNQYLENMQTIAPHAGVVTAGEHYKSQHVNQTMCCIVFE